MKYGCFIGITSYDLVFYQDSIPQENTKSKTTDYDTYIGGPAANAAITYTLLGGKAILITALGNSLIARTMKESIEKEYGIIVYDVIEDAEELPSISGIAVNTQNGSRTIFNGRHDHPREAKHDYIEMLDQISFGLSDCNYPFMSEKAVSNLSEKNIPIMLDAGSWKEEIPFYLSKAHVMIASENCKPPEAENMLVLAKSYHVPYRAITKGEAPLIWETDTDHGKITPPDTTAVDTLAAGDIYHGAFSYFYYVKKLSFVDALKEASVVAAYSVQYKGPREGVKKYCLDNL